MAGSGSPSPCPHSRRPGGAGGPAGLHGCAAAEAIAPWMNGGVKPSRHPRTRWTTRSRPVPRKRVRPHGSSENGTFRSTFDVCRGLAVRSRGIRSLRNIMRQFPLNRHMARSLLREPRYVRAARLLARPATYPNMAREALWNLVPRPLTPLPLSWPLSGSDISDVSVTWPVLPRRDVFAGWLESVRRGLEAHVTVSTAEFEQPRSGIIMFGVRVGGTNYHVALDCNDTSTVDGELASRVPLYFKLQHSLQSYPHTSVVPGGYIVGQFQLYNYLERLRRLRDTRAPLHEVYGRFGKRDVPIRRAMVEELQRQRRFGYRGGFGTVLYVESMVEIARSRVCFDAPGRGSFCLRLCDYLAVGSCIVAMPHQNRLHVPLVDGEHLAYTRADGRDLVDVCASLLEDESARNGLIRRSREYFDRYLEPRQLGAYYIATALEPRVPHDVGGFGRLGGRFWLG